MKISLVIPTLNGGPLLSRVLDAVDSQEGTAELEKLAIYSGSTDGSIPSLKEHGFEIESIEKRAFEHGASRDQAISRTSGEIIVLLTQDAEPANERWLKTLVDCYADPTVGAAYCRQLPRTDCNPFIAARLREWNAGRSERIVQRLQPDQALEDLPPMDRLRLCAFDNVASSVRRSTWSRHRFGPCSFGEDVTFGKKVILDGQSIVFEPDSMVIHSHNRSPRSEGKRIYCDHHNLHELFGIRLLPDYKAWRRGLESERERHAEVVEQLDLPAQQRTRLHSWARKYAFWSTLGMYLGANSKAKMAGPLGPIHRWVDRCMRSGI